MIAKKFPGWKGKDPICLFGGVEGFDTRATPGCDRELVRVVLGLMIAVYSPAGILTAVEVLGRGMGLVIGCCSLHSYRRKRQIE